MGPITASSGAQAHGSRARFPRNRSVEHAIARDHDTIDIVPECNDDSTGSLTKAEFISKADAICKKGNAKIESGFEAFAKENGIKENEEPSKAQGVEVSETVLIPDIENQSEELRALEVPSGDEDEISAMLDALDEGIEEAEADPEALFTSKTDPFGPANKMAKEYGLKICGQE